MPVLLALLLAVAPSPAALKVLQKHECSRCHVVEGVASEPMASSCAGCHVDISTAEGDAARMASGQREFGQAWPGFVARTGEHYTHLPSLVAMGRFQASWLRRFLLAPEDLRPNLSESMIRHAMAPEEIDTLVMGWGAKDDAPPAAQPSPERIAAGEKLFDQKGCAACHLFGNATFPSTGEATKAFTPRQSLRALAPDLMHAKDRLSRTTLEQWIRDPRSVKSDAAMPALELTAAESSLLADFLTFAPPGAPAPAVARRPPPFDPKAPVPTYEEVDAKVFGVLCIHCHEDQHPEGGLMSDGGPGNTGGLGFKGTGLSFEDHAAVQRGSFGPKGKRQSVFRPGASGEPVLLERLRLRYVENDRDFVLPGHNPLKAGGYATETRGMPLGLPAITDEQFSLVERWVRGGHPGPRRHR